MKPLHFAPPQFEPTARLLKAEAHNFGYSMNILKDQDGRVACQFFGGSMADFQAVVSSVLEKHPNAFRGLKDCGDA